MTTTYEKNKEHIYNYVEANRAKYNEYQTKYRNQNRKHYNEVRMSTVYYKKSISYEFEVKRLMNIKI